jgi:hypothetical protein
MDNKELINKIKTYEYRIFCLETELNETKNNLKKYTDYTIPFERSFASHEKSKYWNYEKNENVKPENVYKNSNKRYYFDCGICNCSFTVILSEINKKNIWCDCWRLQQNPSEIT